MKKYYELSGSSESKIIGVRNGIHQGEIKWKRFKKLESEKKILNYFISKMWKSLDTLEPIDFELEYVEAYKSAKMTDFFMFTPALYRVYFLVSEKIIEIFSKHRLPLHTFIPAYVYHKEIKYKYWAFYVPQFHDENFISFDRSVFNKGSLLNKELVTFANITDYKKSGYILNERLVFNSKIDSSLDLFSSSLLCHRYLVSEELKEALENGGVTGVEIIEPTRPFIDFE